MATNEAKKMKPRPFDYVRPDTVDEAVAVLAERSLAARLSSSSPELSRIPSETIRKELPADPEDVTKDGPRGSPSTATTRAFSPAASRSSRCSICGWSMPA